MKLDLFQILYDQKQREEIYHFCKPVFSVGLTPYFENQLIAALVPQSEAEYISVCSWRLKKKRGESAHYLGGFGKDVLSIDTIEKALPFDVAILTPHSSSHKPLTMAANWHGQAWIDSYNAFKPFLKDKLGRVPEELSYSIYENHFIAKADIYKDYVNNLLIPAIQFMEEQGVVFEADSGYLQKKKDPKEIARVQKLLKRNDWPIGVFVLERLFSFYINDKNIKVINL